MSSEKVIKVSKKALKKSQPHYVDNKKLYGYMIHYINEYRDAKENNKPLPRIPEYVGDCILKIATKLSYKHNFISYTYKEEMIGDGIENCIAYMHNFNPDKSNNPFAYFTMIIYNAFLHRIAKEHRQTYVKYKIFENMDIMDELTEFVNSETSKTAIKGSSSHTVDHTERMGKFVSDYETKLKNKKTPKKKGLDVFVEDNEDG